MIWALQRLANLQEQGKIKFRVGFKDSRQYLNSIGYDEHDRGFLYPLGTTCWTVSLDVDGFLPIVPADTLEEAAEKAVEIAERELAEQEERGASRGSGSRGD